MKNINDFTPIEILDEVLYILNAPYAKGGIEIGDIIRKLKDEKQIELYKIDVESILNKIQKDDFARFENTEIRESFDESYMANLCFITLEGRMHYLSGGYKQQFKEKDRLKIVEERQRKQTESLYYLNIIVAIGTAITGILAVIQIGQIFRLIPLIK